MIPRRAGLVLGAALLLVALVPALDVHPAAPGQPLGGLSLVVAVGSTLLAVVALALLPAAWRGGRRSTIGSAVVLLLGIVPALPAFLLPAELVPPGGVLAATVGALLHVTATTLVLLERSSRLLVVAAAIAAVASYAGGVALLAVLLPADLDRVAQTVVAVGLALSSHPVLELLRRTVGRSLYGGRVAPASTVTALGRHLGSGEGVVSGALEDVRSALRLPALELVPAGPGSVGQASVEVPTGAGGGLRLRAGLPPGRARLRRDERSALELIAVPLGLLVRQTQLTTELTAARAAAADAREEERTLLQADLHDRLGPLLTGAGLRLGAARRRLPGDVAAADAHLETVAADLRVATDEVRRVVRRLRPQELDELGLWGAVERRASRLGAVVSLPPARPELAPAVEVAVYRIIAESLANAERHAPGAVAEVRVGCTSAELDLTVVNPAQVVTGRAAGVGLTSVRARAAELGGCTEVGAVPGGWRVHVRLPLAPGGGGRSADDDGELPGGDELTDHRHPGHLAGQQQPT